MRTNIIIMQNIESWKDFLTFYTFTYAQHPPAQIRAAWERAAGERFSLTSLSFIQKVPGGGSAHAIGKIKGGCRRHLRLATKL